MGELFPVDLTSLFVKAIEADKRPPDGKLHASSDLLGSLRHTQLRAIGAPMRSPDIASQIRLMTGTLWHRFLENLLHEAGIEVHTEVKLDDWLPSGWSGTADYVFKHPDYDAYVLGDLKTAKGESIFFINRDGAKQEHIWQLSAYFWALVAAGKPMLDSVGVLYVPMNAVSTGEVKPSFQEVTPIPEEVISLVMEERANSVAELRALIAADGYHFDSKGLLSEFGVPLEDGNPRLLELLTDVLAPEQERLQKIVWDGNKSILNVVLVPHWSAAYCDYDEPLCGCRNQQKSEKIGHYDLEGEYHPRKGYEDIVPLVEPTRKELNERRASVEAE